MKSAEECKAFMINTVLFDLDGTLIDSLDAIAKSFVRTGNRLGLNVDPGSVREIIGASGEMVVLRLFNRRSIIKKSLEIFQDEYNKIWRGEIKLYPEVYATLKSLKELKIKMAVVSSTFKNLLKPILEHFNFMPFLDTFIGGDEIKRGKPEPDMALEVMKRLDARADECIVIGDTLFDIEMGKRAGMHTVLVVRRPIFLARSRYLPEYVISNLLDVIGILSNFHKQESS